MSEVMDFVPIPDIKPFILRRYSTARDVLWEMWGPTFRGIPREDVEASNRPCMGGYNPDGTEAPEVSYRSMLADIEASGLWGFSDSETRTVHYWMRSFDPDAPIDLRGLIEFFAHEFAHLEFDADEALAERVRQIAGDAVRSALEVHSAES